MRDLATWGLAHVEVINLAASPPLHITFELTLVSSTGLASPAAATTGLGTFRGCGVSGGRCCVELLTGRF